MSALITWPLGGAGTILTYGLGRTGAAVDFRQAVLVRLAAAGNVVALVGSRIYPGHIPQSSPLPALVYSVVSGTRVHHLRGASGVAEFRVQFSAFARKLSEAAAIVEALRQDLDGLQGVTIAGSVVVLSVLIENEVDSYDEPEQGGGPGTHQIAVDYLFKVRESIPTLM